MAASDAVGIRAFNQSVDRGRRREAEDKAEGRQQTQDERQDILFNRSTTLFEDQQRFLNDEIAQKKLSKKLNRAMSIYNASGGQVYQPYLNAYADIPDGGKMLSFRRNDDATFDYEIEWQGKRFKKKGATFDEVGKFMMSIANPVLYLEQSGAIAAARQEHEDAKELARIKAGVVPRDLIRGTNLTVSEYNDARKKYSDDYFELLEARALNPEDESLNNEVLGEDDKFGVLTHGEYIDQQFDKIGINVAGAVLDDKGILEQRPHINGATATFTEILSHFNRDVFGAANDSEAFEFAIELMLENERFDEAENVIKTSGLQAVPEVQKRVTQALAAARAKAASKSGADADATAADVEAAKITVGGGDETTQTKAGAPVANPIASFADSLTDTARAAIKPFGDFRKFVGEQAAKAARSISRNESNRIWNAIASGNPRKGTVAFKLLQASLTEEGKAKVSEIYESIRAQLEPGLRDALDKNFLSSNTRLANSPIPDETPKEAFDRKYMAPLSATKHRAQPSS